MEKKIGLYIGLDSIDFSFDTKEKYDDIAERYSIGGGNFGNKFFLSTEIGYMRDEIDFAHIIRYSDLKNNYFISDLTIDQVNSNFRAIVLPQANIFNPNKRVLEQLRGFTAFIRMLKIPIYVIGVGIQAKTHSELKYVCKTISDVAKRFCDAVYATGGDISLRGYVTKELLDMLGYPNAVVTGCPSLFRKGKNFKIECEKKEEIRNFRPVMNGYSYSFLNKAYTDNFKKYNAYYMDQDEFMGLLYGKEADENSIYRLIHKYTLDAIESAASGRVCLLYDVSLWDAFLKHHSFNFCFGFRIHGNILSITNGIPSTVIAHDCRTYELAEYFNIPYIKERDVAHTDLYNAYLNCDYNTFNKTYKDKYEIFVRFMVEKGLFKNDISILKESNTDEFVDINNSMMKDLSGLGLEIGMLQKTYGVMDGIIRNNKHMAKIVYLKCRADLFNRIH